jgi:general secretion pathway protein L
VIAVPFIRQSLALADVDAQIAALRPRIDQVDALRRQIAAGSAGAGRIAAARERGTVALRVLGDLTDLLPDDTYLTSVALRRTQLTIEGHSTAATKLIAAMAADPQLKNPAFGAPVVRAENGTDIFTIQAGFGS